MASKSTLRGKRSLVLLIAYAGVILFLGLRSVIPGWEDAASPYGRGFGSWSMYGNHAEVISVVADSNGKKLDAVGLWQGDFVSPATPHVAEAVVDEYARFLHNVNNLGVEDPVRVVVTYTVDSGPEVQVEGTYR